jgi:hypothetical protein
MHTAIVQLGYLHLLIISSLMRWLCIMKCYRRIRSRNSTIQYLNITVFKTFTIVKCAYVPIRTWRCDTLAIASASTAEYRGFESDKAILFYTLQCRCFKALKELVLIAFEW